MNHFIKNIVAISVLIFILQFTSISLLHNHNLDLNQHFDCPAFVLSTTLVSFVFTILFLYNSDLPVSSLLRSINLPQKRTIITNYCRKDRAPPL